MSAPEVKADIKVVRAKRRATFDVAVATATGSPGRITAEVQVRQVTVYGGVDFGRGAIVLPKTHAALDALEALLTAVRAELNEQGVTE